MFANFSTASVANLLLSLTVAATPLIAAAQQPGYPVRSNPALRRPTPVAARSMSRQPPVTAYTARQESLPPGQPALRTPPPAAILDGDPQLPRQIVEGPVSGAPEVYYDDGGMYGGHYGGYGNGFDAGIYPNTWAAPMLPMLSGVRLSVRGEFLYWWSSPLNTPVLASSSPANVDVDEAGVLGEPGTSVLLGTRLNDDIRPGGRFTGNLWFDSCQQHGIEASYTFLPGRDTNFLVTSDQIPVITRPFFNTEIGQQDAELVAFPGQLTGSLAINTESFFHTGDVAYRWNVCCNDCRRIDLMVGWRYGYLRDQVHIRERLTSIDDDSGITPGTTITVNDNFEARNYFNGVEIGVAGQRQTFLGCADFWLKTAFGNTRFRSDISGSTAVTANGQTVTTNEGFLALPTNIGRRDSDEFSTLTELGVKLNRDFGCWRASVGYSVVYWSCLGRGGDLIDTEVNTSQLPPGPLDGSPTPRFRERQSCFWAQGINFGLERCF